MSSSGARSSPRTNASLTSVSQRRPSQRSVHTRRRPTSIHICRDMTNNSSSRPDTPVTGLESHELRTLRKNYEAATKMLEISCRVVAKYIGREADEETVLAAIKEILQEDGYTRSFSQLLYEDLEHLSPKGCLGSVMYDKSKRTISPPPYFLEHLRDAMAIMTRDKEAGNRVIIAEFLIAAIKIARQEFNMPRLALHSEVDVKGETIPEVGFIHGVLDFVAAQVTGEGSLDKTMLEGRNAGTVYRMNTPYLIVCEAKKSSTVGKRESEAELLGQLRVLMIKHGETSKTGILADGYHWRLFHFDADLILYYGELDLDSDDHRLELLGILSLLVAGRGPILKGPHNNDESFYLVLDR